MALSNTVLANRFLWTSLVGLDGIVCDANLSSFVMPCIAKDAQQLGMDRYRAAGLVRRRWMESIKTDRPSTTFGVTREGAKVALSFAVDTILGSDQFPNGSSCSEADTVYRELVEILPNLERCLGSDAPLVVLARKILS